MAEFVRIRLILLESVLRISLLENLNRLLDRLNRLLEVFFKSFDFI